MADTNLIPSLFSAGSFVALPPFDKVVDESVYYTVEAITTVRKLQAAAPNLYDLMFAPIGVSTADYPTILSRASAINAGVIILTSKNNPDVYVLSSYLKSFPLIDGETYENIIVYANLGAVPKKLKDVCNTLLSHMRDYITANLGIANPVVTIGSVPTRGYVSAEDAAIFESTRLNSIEKTVNDVSLLNAANDTIDRQRVYIQKLEAKVKEYSEKENP